MVLFCLALRIMHATAIQLGYDTSFVDVLLTDNIY